MDQIPSQPTLTPTPPVSPVIPAPKTTVFPIFFTILFLAVFSVAGYFGYQNLPAVKVDRLIKDCLSRGGSIGESYPPQCFTPTPTPTQFADPTANWKLYTDIQNRYSVKYPENFKITDYAEGNYKGIAMALIGESQKASGRTETELSDGIVVKTIIINDPKKSIEQYAQEQKSAEGDAASQIVTTKLESQIAYEFTANGWWGRTRVIYSGVNNFVIRLSANINGADSKISEYKKIVDQILSTFKFIDNNNTDGILEATVMRSPTCAGAQRVGDNCEAPVVNGVFDIYLVVNTKNNEAKSKQEIFYGTDGLVKKQTVSTNANGQFIVALEAGSYQIRNTLTGIGNNINDRNFTIVAGQTTTKRFDIDTEIR
ncbi:hypothetical protein HYU91_02345 [Candidatus Collierbacteria bacterium]|nr:hypothetical protein [Candidatus Collierbacteria bacterium]